jgi:hypothetical protein
MESQPKEHVSSTSQAPSSPAGVPLIAKPSAGAQAVKAGKTPAKTPPASRSSSQTSVKSPHKSSRLSKVSSAPTLADRPRRVLTPRPIIRNDFAQSDYKPLHDFWSASDDPDGKRNEISFQNPEIDIPEVKYVTIACCVILTLKEKLRPISKTMISLLPHLMMM